MSKIARMVDHRVRLALLALVMTAAMTIGIAATAGAAVSFGSFIPLSVPASVSGSLSASGDSLVDGTTRYFKAYSVTLTAGTSYVITMDSSDGAIDPYLYLLDSSKNIIDYDDDGGGNVNSRIAFTPTATGTYFLLASSYSGKDSGTYALKVMTAGKISGTVTDSSGQPISGIDVTAYQYYSDGSGGGWWDSVAYAQTDMTGNYTLDGLATGNYRVEFRDYNGDYVTQYFNNKPTLDTASDVAVTAGQTKTGINAKLATAGKISGTVTNSSGEALSYIYVIAYQYVGGAVGFNWVGSTWTNESGNYTIGGLATGTYRVEFQDYNGDYLIQCFNNQPTIDAADDVSVTAGQETTGIDAQLAAAGKISGTVTDSSGQPISGIDVTAYQYYSDWSGGGWWDTVAYAQTDMTGNYTLDGLAAGTYRVGFRDYNGDYVTQYYNNKSTIDTATDVAVTAGQETTGIDAQLATAGKISGTVTNSSGQALSHIYVSAYLYNSQDGSYNWASSAWTDDTGNCVIKGLATGTYRVEFWDGNGDYLTQYFNNQPTIDAATDVSVTAGQTKTGINAQLVTAGKISGTVTNSSGAALSGISVRASYYYDSQDGGWWETGAEDLTDDSGNYTLGGLLAGTYRVMFQDGNGDYLTQYYNNQPTIDAATDVSVTVGQETTGIDAQLATAGKISGTVTNSSGQALSGICVNAYRYHTEDYGGWWEWIANTWTGDSGNYTLGGLTNGTYRVEFYDYNGDYLTQCYNNKPTIDVATDVSVTVGQETTGIDAQLATAGKISGTVTDSSGQVLPGISVDAYRYSSTDDFYYWVSSAGTDESGNYTIGGLAAGDYRVEFYDGNGGYLAQYYNNQPTLDAATDVPVTVGQTTPAINAQLVTAGKISGTVTNSSGQPLSGIYVYCYVYDSKSGSWQSQAIGFSTDKSGNYTIGGLPTGNYRVKFQDHNGNYLTQYYNNKLTIDSATDVAVTVGQITPGINAKLVTAGKITGTVTNSSGEPLSDIWVSVCRYDPEADGTFYWVSSASTDANGSYVIKGLDTGTYRVEFRDWTGNYATEYYNNKPTIDAATAVSVTASQTTPDIDAQLGIAGKISGTVTDSSGQPLSDIAVTVYQYNPGSAGSYYWVSEGGTDENGDYTLGGLATGTYRVEFRDWTGNYATEYYNNKLTIDAATAVSVTAGQTTPDIDAQLGIAGKVSGKVTNSSGQALADMHVIAYRYNTGTGKWELVTESWTDGSGVYTLAGLNTGTYRIKCMDEYGKYVTQYYDNKATVESGADVSVTVGQTTQNINFKMLLPSEVGTTYTITFDANGGTGAPAAQTKTSGVTLLLSSTAPTRTGYTFLGWATSKTATTATWQPGALYTADGNATLYAVWKADTYALTVNGGAGATGFGSYTAGTVVSITAGTAPTGMQFKNWTSTGGGTFGNANAANTTFTMPAGAATVTANWQAITYTVSFDANGGAGAPANQTKTYGVTLQLSSVKPTRTGYTFLGWSTSKTATSATYGAGGNYTNDAAVTLYAVWQINTYTVSYDANGGAGAPGTQTKTYGVTLQLSATVPTRTGYAFLGWSTSKTATTATYLSGANFTGNVDTILYAVWKVNTYTVSYDANGGAGAPGTQTKTYGVTLQLSSVKPTRAGYTFLGWATSKTATAATYQPGASYTANAAATLYAVWKVIPPPVVTRMGGADRYETAVKIAKQGWPSGASTVLLASGANYPDALAATPLAAMKNAPILLTTTASTPAVTMTEIKVLKPKSIILLGGTGVISAAQATALKNAGYSVTRYGGADRYATAQLISNAVEALGGSKTAILVTGMNYPDALIMGPVAGMNKMPIIFSSATDIPAQTKTFITANKITKIITVGYTAGNATIMSQAKSAVGAANVTAITGTDGYVTSVAVANKYKASFANGVAVATGANFPDALTGGALAAKMKFPVLLINPTSGASAGAKAYVKALPAPAIYVYGGTGVLTDAIVQGLYK